MSGDSTTGFNVSRLLDACVQAAIWHGEQKRRSGIPYVTHPLSVAQILSELYPLPNNSILIAAVLHDVIEDTKATHVDIEAKFGLHVAELVVELTNDKNQMQVLGKTQYLYEKMRTISYEAMMIKLADRLHNIYDMLPASSKDEKAKEYARGTWNMIYAAMTRPGLQSQHKSLISQLTLHLESAGYEAT